MTDQFALPDEDSSVVGLPGDDHSVVAFPDDGHSSVGQSPGEPAEPGHAPDAAADGELEPHEPTRTPAAGAPPPAPVAAPVAGYSVALGSNFGHVTGGWAVRANQNPDFGPKPANAPVCPPPPVAPPVTAQGEPPADQIPPDQIPPDQIPPEHDPEPDAPSVEGDAAFRRVIEAATIPDAPDAVSNQAGSSVQEGPSAQGHVDGATGERISGWSWDPDLPSVPVALEIFDNDEPVARVLASLHRQDLELAGIGGGLHGFEHRFDGGLDPERRHVISVRRESDGRELEGSPVVVERASVFTGAFEATVAAAIATVGPGVEQAHVLDFIIGQADRLLEMHAGGEGRSAARLAHEQFMKRWAAGDPTVDDADGELRALFVGDAVPDATGPAGKGLRSAMRALQREGYTVSFVASATSRRTSPASELLEADGVICCHAPFYASVEEVMRRRTGRFDVICLHGSGNAARYMWIARELAPKARILYAVDTHETRPSEARAASHFRVASLTAALVADAVLAPSAVEASLLRRAVPEARIHVLPVAERELGRAILAAIADVPAAG